MKKIGSGKSFFVSLLVCLGGGCGKLQGKPLSALTYQNKWVNAFHFR